MKLKSIIFAALTSALLLSPAILQAQDQQDSVADAARKAQADRKAIVKPAVVYSNDNLDTIKGAISIVGEAPTPPPVPADKAKSASPTDKSKTDASTDAAKTDATKTDATNPDAAKTDTTKPDETKTDATSSDNAPHEKSEAEWRQEFAEARRELADDSHELDILQREFNLKTEQYYTDPNVALKEQYTNDDLNKTRKAIDDKTEQVAKEKQAISDLQDALRQAGGDSGWGREP